jgi:hypothetical protein
MAKNDIKYFTVNVASGNDEHVGIICVNMLFPHELTEKVKTACMEHFDAEVEIPELDVNNYLEGRSGTVKLKIVEDDEEFEEFEVTDDEIFIQETWLY